MQDRLDRAPKSMRVRRATVEHPFGTLKAWMGATHFKTRTLEKVRTEMSLHVLAYNLKRVSMTETNCAKWRRESVPVGLREKGCEAPIYFHASMPIYILVARSPSFGVFGCWLRS